MYFNILEDEIGQLVLINNNLKKSINKKFRLETLQAKLKYANALYTQIEINLQKNEDLLSGSELTFLVKAARNAITEIRNIIYLKLEDKNKSKMALSAAAAPIFDYKQASSLIQPYDGNASNLDTFLDSIRLLKELTPDALIPTAISFIKIKLSGKARLCLPENIATIEQLEDIVRARCEDKTTPENIIAKLNAYKQRGTINGFCEEIENLCAKLENTYLKQQVPVEVAKNMATKAGLNALINGINAPETKLIL